MNRRATKEGYWISPAGEITLVQQTHVFMLCLHPEFFGLTPEYVRSTYEAHGEAIPEEKRAREVLIRQLVARDWVRARRYAHGWTVNIGDFSPRNMGLVRHWARALHEGYKGVQERDLHVAVLLDSPHGQQTAIFAELLTEDGHRIT